MRRLLPALALLLLAPAGASADRPVKPSATSRAVPGEVVVRFKAGVDPAGRRGARSRAGARFDRSLRLPRTQVLETHDVRDAVRSLRGDSRVAFAQRNWIRTRRGVPNDPDFGLLWGLHNLGQAPFGGTLDADIDAVEAWDRVTGSDDVVVAVVDEGIAYDHPDLADNMWTGAPLHGYDFHDNDENPYDIGGHGTHVAGTIAAQGNNGIGVAGVAWDAQLMALRVLGPQGGSDDDIADAFHYAAENGAKVVNASLGGSQPAPVIEAAMAASPEVLYVVAAGNDGSDNDVVGDYPCNTPLANVICVAATDEDDRLASFSNYGSENVDVAAPGVSTRSALHGRYALAEDFAAEPHAFDFGAPWAPSAYEDAEIAETDATATNVDGALELTAPLDLTGITDCSVSFWGAFELGLGDTLRLQKWFDGEWTQIGSWTGKSPSWDDEFFDFFSFPLGTVGPETSIRLLFDAATLAAGPSTVYADDISILCADFDETSYTYADGTSMATPHVAGAAALLLAFKPDATIAQLRNALLNSGDLLPDAAHRSRIGSGRRLNVNNAVDVVDDPIVTLGPLAATTGGASVTATTATLDGTVATGGGATTYRFEYGQQATLGAASAPLGPITADAPVSTTITGLQPGTTYFYRVAAERNGTTAVGEHRSFTTLLEDPVPVQFGDDPTASCKRKRSGKRLKRVRCRANAALAARVTYRITRKGRTVALGSGEAGKRIRLKLRKRIVKRGRYRLIVTFTAADGRTKVVRRRVRL